jgi:hypothetical protein
MFPSGSQFANRLDDFRNGGQGISGRNGRGFAMAEGAVAFGQVFAELRVDLRWPTLADREFVTVIAVMLLIAKGTP